MRTRGLFSSASLPLLALVLAAQGCSTSNKGGLILAISTDLQTPKDIDVVSVFITTNGVPKYDFLGRVLPTGQVALPSTLAIVEPDDPSAKVRIRVTGFQTVGGQESARILRDIVTTVPHERTALLHVNLSFLDDKSGQGTIPPDLVPDVDGGAGDGLSSFDPTMAVSSHCGDQSQTEVAGLCVGSDVDATQLPDYADKLVFGPTGSATAPDCFAVDQCLAQAAPIPMAMITTAQDGSCSLPLTAGESGDHWNCALATKDGSGTCAGGVCFVPLDANTNEGFTIQPGKAIVMVPGLCKKLAAGDVTLYVDRASCPTKAFSSPMCEPGQGTGPVADGGVVPEAGGPGQDAAVPPADGGGSGPDGGAPPIDAGGPSPDAGAPSDAGTGPG